MHICMIGLAIGHEAFRVERYSHVMRECTQ